MATRYVALGPLLSGEGSRAFLGLRIQDEEASPCALIWVPERVMGEPELVEQLRRDTSRAAGLVHPNVVRVHGLIEVDEGLARVVEFADGESLRRILDVAQRLPSPFAARVAVDAALGVQYAHLAANEDGSPLVHGDLRPETLLVSYSGLTKVSGYGALTVAPKEMGGQRVLGRRMHCAPEQVLGGRQAVTAQTDVYLLGLILYEALTGDVPFAWEKDFDKAVLNKNPPLLNSEQVPPRLRPVIGKAMAKKGNLRFPTVQAFREAVEEAVGELPEWSEFGAFLERAFVDDPARAARRRELDNGVQEWVVRKGLRLAAPSVPPPMPPRRRPSVPEAAAAPTPEPAAEPAAAPPAPPAVPSTAAPAEPPAQAPAPPAAPAPAPTVAAAVPASAAAPAPVAAPVAAAAPSAPPAAMPAVATPAVAPGAAPAATAAPVAPSVPAPVPAPAAAPPAARRGAPAWALALPLGAIIALAGFWMGRQGAPQRVDAPPAPAPAAPAAETPAPPPAPAPPTVAAAPPRPAPAPAPALPAALPAIPLEKPTLEVITDPPLTVSIDGKLVGRTPFKVPVAPGKHKVSLVDRAQGIRLARTVHARPGLNRLALTVGKGSVAIDAPPGCEVRVDGRLVGKTPLDPVPVWAGSHRLEVRKGAARWQQAFSVAEGERMNYTIEISGDE